MVHASRIPFALTMLTIYLLTVSHRLAPASDANWCNKVYAMCYQVYVIMNVKNPQLSVLTVGPCVP